MEGREKKSGEFLPRRRFRKHRSSSSRKECAHYHAGTVRSRSLPMGGGKKSERTRVVKKSVGESPGTHFTAISLRMNFFLFQVGVSRPVPFCMARQIMMTRWSDCGTATPGFFFSTRKDERYFLLFPARM